MNKIVRDCYPLEKVPEELCITLDPTQSVTLVLEQGNRRGDPDPLSRHHGRFADRNVTDQGRRQAHARLA